MKRFSKLCIALSAAALLAGGLGGFYGEGHAETAGAFYGKEAQDLYHRRGEDFDNARKAAEIYRQLGMEAEQEFEKAQFKIKEAQALYFYGDLLSSDLLISRQKKEELHRQGFETAHGAVRLLTGRDRFSDSPKDPAHKRELALAHYFSAGNMGRWALARGIPASLGKWPEMVKHLEAVVKNDPSVEDYGVDRIFGRAYMKLPLTAGGSYEKSEKHLKKAYESTLHRELETSVNATTTAYYLDILATRDNSEAFCPVYRSFSALLGASEQELERLNPEMLPETQLGLERFQSGTAYDQDIHGYFDSNC